MQKLFSQAMMLFSVVAFFISCDQSTTTTQTVSTEIDTVFIVGKVSPPASAGITITTSTVLVPEYMAAGGSNEMFVKDDPNNATFLANIKAGNFGAWTGSVEGGNAQWFHWKEPFGSKGMGMNVQEGAPCDILNGDLCKKNLKDFNIAWLDLLKNTGTKAVYTANIARGTLAELKYALTTRPDIKVVMLGQELPSADPRYANLSSKEYPVKFYAWADSIRSWFPTRTFYVCADMPDIGQKKSIWTNDFIAYKKLPTWICLRQYSHYFQQGGKLTGKINNDSAMYSDAIKTALPKQIKNIDSTFTKGGVYISQFSTGIPAYAVKDPALAIQFRCLDAMYYLRAEKVFIEAHRDKKWNCLGVSVIGIKQIMSKIDFKFLGIGNRVYGEGRYATTVTHTLGSQVDILPTSLNGMYYVAIINRSGKEVALPTTWNLDGKLVTPVYSKGDGYSCTDLSSTTGLQFNPLTGNKLPAFGIVFMEVKAP